VVSLATCLKAEVIPAQQLLEDFFGRPIPAIVYEDNAAALTAVHKGYSPNMRYLKRTQRISIGMVNDVIVHKLDDKKTGQIQVVKCATSDQKGDVFTKELPRAQFESALAKIRMIV